MTGITHLYWVNYNSFKLVISQACNLLNQFLAVMNLKYLLIVQGDPLESNMENVGFRLKVQEYVFKLCLEALRGHFQSFDNFIS